MSFNDLKKVGRYEIQEPLGKGGFATVFLGRDPYINRAVALKVSEAGNVDLKQPLLSRLFQEAAAAGRLIHPNIVTIYDVGIEDTACYIAMEYIDGATLFKYCHRNDRLSIAEAIDVMIKVCHGLDFAHQRGIIHRDIKPSNILLGTTGDIKITDFGLACLRDLANIDHKTVGTPSYMPPEQVQGKGSVPQSDLFSAGIVLYQLLSGTKPFEALDPLEMRRKIVREPHIPLQERNPELPSELYAIVDRTLAKKPEERYPSGMDLARDLEGVLHGSSGKIGDAIANHVRELRTLRFFEEFTEHEIAKVLTIGAWITCADKEPIIQEGELGDSFFVIVTGEAKACVGKKEVGNLSRGDCFGEISFLLGRERSATIAASGECRLLKLNPTKINILDLATQIKIYRLFARTVAGHLLRIEGITA